MEEGEIPVDDFQLEDDSEEMPEEIEGDASERHNVGDYHDGYGAEMLTETGEDA